MTQSPPKQPSFGFLALAIIAALPVLGFFLFGTFNLYAGNADEFDAGFRDILPRYLPAMAIAWLALAGIGMLLRGSIRQRYACALLGFGVLIWAQGTFFAGDYGVLDGRGLNWQAFAFPAWLDIALWAGILVGFVIGYRRIRNIALPASVALITLQFIAGLHAGLTSEQRVWSASGLTDSGPPEGIFHYSRTNNVVHLILDNFQTDIFEEIVEEEGLEEAFDGFVLFRENASVAPYTTMAIPSIFSGQVYDGTEHPGAFFQRGTEEGFYSVLHEHGYKVNLSTLRSLANSRYDHHYRIPAIHGANASELIHSEATRLADITLFRHVPHLARNWIYNDNNWRLRPVMANPEILPKSFSHKRFFRDYTGRLDPVNDEPAYHFLHLWPPHPPYVTTAQGNYAGKVLPNTRENYKNEARDILRYVVEFLEALKARNIYDDTLIVLHSDHGGAFEPEFTPSRMLAMNVIKPRNSRGPLQVSNAQVSLADVAATILRKEGIEIEWPGRSVFEVDEDEVRERRFVFYHGGRNEYLRPIRIFGSLYSADSYTHLESIELDFAAAVYAYGEIMSVGVEGTGSTYLDEGWSTPDPGIVWNNGHEATLRIPIDPPEGDLDLTVWLVPNVYDEVLPRQRIRIYVADEQVGDWELERREGVSLQAQIPARLIDSDELVIRFELPDAASQVELGVGGDKRTQAIALRRFRVERNR